MINLKKGIFHFKHRWRQIILCTFILNASIGFAETITVKSKTSELTQVNQQIKGLQNTLTAAHSQQSNLQYELKKLETHLGKLSDHAAQTKQKLIEQQSQLAKVTDQQKQYQQALINQQNALAAQIKASYMLGNHEYFKMILNQQDPENVSRMLVYYQYLNKARSDAINQIQATITNINHAQDEIQHQTSTLQNLQTQEQREQQALENSRAKRQQVLASVNSSIQSKAQQLQKLTKDRRALQMLVDRLKRQASTVQQPKVPFADMRGKLTWPVKGRITERYGSHMYGTIITLPGIQISAPMGTPIRAVYPGKVIFSNWLRGIGLLIIIDHGNGFMTLYGHAQSLYENAGDMVKAGQIIATVGDSGGIKNSGLYFQIRDNGKPLNPELWLKS